MVQPVGRHAERLNLGGRTASRAGNQQRSGTADPEPGDRALELTTPPRMPARLVERSRARTCPKIMASIVVDVSSWFGCDVKTWLIAN